MGATVFRSLGARVGVALLGTLLLVALFVGSWSRTRAQVSSTQPIAFSHRIHAGDYEMPCLYCHIYADRAPVAGVPPLKTCMGCHELVASDRPEIEKLTSYWTEERPIEWLKVYDLPDFVRFNHKRHVRAGVGCENCHGAVETMDEVRKVNDLTMGSCVLCHEDRNAEIDCVVCHY